MPRVIYILSVVCAVYVIIDVWTQKTAWNDGRKVLWTIAALLFSIITAVVYFISTRRSY